MQHRLGVTEVDELLAAYLAGERVNDLAARFGVHRTTVMVHLARRGAARPTRDWDTDALTTAAQLYNQGLSLAAVADRFEINPSTVATGSAGPASQSGPDGDGLGTKHRRRRSSRCRSVEPSTR